jgi:pimeloyl-ACP methyl ester carboxylesterase
MIPFIHFGGSGPPLHFAHANGYPPNAYKPFIETLTARYRVFAMLTRPLWPASSPNGLQDWSPLADDLLKFLDERREQGDDLHGLIGVGHSLGGVLTLMAALRRPALFRALVLIDPVLLPYPILFWWTLFYKLGLGYRLHPLAPAALRRRRVFESAEAMYVHYRRKPVFKRIGDHGLRTYVNALAHPRPDGRVELAYAPEWEARIYVTGPLYEWKLWPQIKDLRPPLLIIRGQQTDTFWPNAARMVQRRLPHAVIHTIPNAGHLVPLEKPDEVGRLICEFLDKIQTQKA